MQPESKVNLTRKESTRRGIELRDEGQPYAVDLARQESAKPSSSSKNRNPKEEDIPRSASYVSNFFKPHEFFGALISPFFHVVERWTISQARQG